MGSIITDDVFANLATRSGLHSLGLGSLLTPRQVSYSQGQGEHRLFPDLQNLTCTASLDGAINLSIHLSQLTKLEISLLGTGKASEEQRFIPILSAACPNIHHLDIRYTAEQPTNLQARDILAL
ncbi:hypothetical protein L873DRAFT_1822399 [Choiromyces venosus 120613-1]|uniref:RNI-like protein n=1 Tax=Choiromyces venosus 120613-1 TaxID=1336337 RepID=A0A3N4IZE8_9PEZI|nr:hypothetical protein L873DRAFT_1822399 [Choiromyces venosus 120613-1]